MADTEIRAAVSSDIPAIVNLLADDPLGATRETPGDLAPYEDAFRRLDIDPNQTLVAAIRDGDVVGTLQLTIIPGLSRRGSTRAAIEAVRVRRDVRGAGLGEQLIRWAIAEAGRRGCQLVQLTSDNARPDAHRFYERLGFTGSHVGFKLPI